MLSYPGHGLQIRSTDLVVELYGLVNHVLVTLLESQVLAPTRLDKSLHA